jgi:hypothetical protein
MDGDPTHAPAPDGWLKILEESQAELAAGLSVPGDAVRQKLRDSLARLEAARDTVAPRRAGPCRVSIVATTSGRSGMEAAIMQRADALPARLLRRFPA